MPNIKDALGLQDAHKTYKQCWLDHGFNSLRKQGDKTTETIKEMFSKEENQIKNFFEKRLNKKLEKAKSMETKASIDRSVMEDSIPIIFDPEVLKIMKETDPILDRLPQEGYDGYTVVSNRIDSYGEPLGMESEDQVIDLSTESGNAMDVKKIEKKMKIYHDVASISDFTQRAGKHYMNIRDTALGTKLAAHANFKASQVLYGDPDMADTDGSVSSIDDGSIFDNDAYEGLAEILPSTDKSGVDITGEQALLKDIKSEVKDLLQSGYNVNKNDLEIWTSHDVFDYLENEMGPKVRLDREDDSFDYGFGDVRISGIPVIPSHNVKQHSTTVRNDADDDDVTFTKGDHGDVFIANTRSIRFRSLAPLSTLPLARVGLADRVALYEYGVLTARAAGNWGKYLNAYSV